jgi:hypothetical protein
MVEGGVDKTVFVSTPEPHLQIVEQMLIVMDQTRSSENLIK